MEQTADRLINANVSATDRLSVVYGSSRLLRLMILSMILLVITVEAIAIVLQWFNLIPAGSIGIISINMLVILIAFGSAYWLLQHDRAALAGHVFFYSFVVLCTITINLIGGFSGPFIMAYLIPVVAASQIGNELDGARVGTVAIAGYIINVLLQEMFGLQPIIPLGTLTVYTFVFVLISSVALLSVLARIARRDITNVLKESQERADELLQKTNELMERGLQQIELGSELTDAAAQLQQTSQQQASGATEQASAVAQVSSTIEELGNTARQIAQAADHVSQAAQQTLEQLSEGQMAVDESIQAMERIRTRMQDISSRVLELGERSQKIGEIIDLIDDISDATHLLALNAAIEAAGAGEHGRRFAVVAAEVKSLANRTLGAAKEVQGVIAEIRQATSTAVLAAEEGTKEVERGVELSNRAGQSMDNAVMVAERTAQSASEIELATAQQKSASEQVVETMREIAEVVRQSATGARQMATSSTHLRTIADRLHSSAEE